jgi:hypothetical protein
VDENEQARVVGSMKLVVALLVAIVLVVVALNSRAAVFLAADVVYTVAYAIWRHAAHLLGL